MFEVKKMATKYIITNKGKLRYLFNFEQYCNLTEQTYETILNDNVLTSLFNEAMCLRLFCEILDQDQPDLSSITDNQYNEIQSAILKRVDNLITMY